MNLVLKETTAWRANRRNSVRRSIPELGRSGGYFSDVGLRLGFSRQIRHLPRS